MLEQAGEVGGRLVMKGFEREERTLNWIYCGTGRQWRSWRARVMWSRERE